MRAGPTSTCETLEAKVTTSMPAETAPKSPGDSRRASTASAPIVTRPWTTAPEDNNNHPLFPSLVAVMVAEPVASAVTSPLALTVAAFMLLLVHVTVRPVSTLPFASFSVAVNWTVLPTLMLADAGVTVTVATGGGFTVIDAVPLLPSLVAVIVTDPTATPVTSPLPETGATVGSLLVQVTVRPLKGLPSASSGVAVSCWVPPTRIVAAVGLTLTDATGT